MRSVIGLAALGVLLAACAGSQSVVDSNEDFLAAAGFRALGAETSGYAAAQKQLPPHKFVHLVEQGIPTYYYFDPTICGCLYYGSEQNWATYKQEMAEKRHIQAEQLLIREETPLMHDGHS